MTPRLALSLAFAACALAQTPPPAQPIPFSHKQHAGTLKLACKMCHQAAGSGERMTYPATSTCMQCHSAIGADKPDIQKLAAFAKDQKPVPWVPVYRIPSYVDFSHKTHLAAGAECENCHGPVATRDALSREGDISMGGCMNCHRQRKVSIDCTFCHEDMQQEQ